LIKIGLTRVALVKYLTFHYKTGIVMIKKIAIAILICYCFSCHKSTQQVACGTQACTEIFASIGVKFVDKSGNAVAVKNFSAINQRTNARLTYTLAYDLMPGYYIIADDGTRSQLSTGGDEVLVTGTHPTTNQTKTVTFKISGGCNCHVEKISGAETVTFD
jgi:hypothetical protein